MKELPPEAAERLSAAKNIWIATIYPAESRPHLTPIWFVYQDGLLYFAIDAASIKMRNLQANPHVALALEDGQHPVICEGTAAFPEPPYPPDVLETFFKKYEWDIPTDPQYNRLVQVTPRKWMVW